VQSETDRTPVSGKKVLLLAVDINRELEHVKELSKAREKLPCVPPLIKLNFCRFFDCMVIQTRGTTKAKAIKNISLVVLLIFMMNIYIYHDHPFLSSKDECHEN
jgi:hypothetical protein